MIIGKTVVTYNGKSCGAKVEGMIMVCRDGQGDCSSDAQCPGNLKCSDRENPPEGYTGSLKDSLRFCYSPTTDTNTTKRGTKFFKK